MTLSTEQRAPCQPAAEPKGLRMADVVRFHVPVAATILSYAIIFNVMNGAIARTASAAAALAAFGVAQSLVDLFGAPSGVGNQWIVSRGRDRGSLGVGFSVLAQIVGGLTLLFLLLGWTPLGRWVCIDVFGAPARLYPSINLAIKICLLMPLVWAVRNAAQGILMIRRQTHVMAVGVIVRLGCVWAAALGLLRLPGLDGAAMGGILWMIGMGVESVLLLLAARPHLRKIPVLPADAPLPSRPQIWRFAVPLMGTSFMWALARPLVNAAMARTAFPEISIAAYQVAWPAAFLLLCVQMEFRQTVAVLWSDRASFKVLWTYGLCVGGGISALMLMLGATGMAAAFMSGVLGAPAELASIAGRLFLILGLVPLLWMLSEIYIGCLLRRGATGFVVVAKAANIAAMVTVMFGLAALAPGLGPAVGAIGVVAGHCAELLAIRGSLRRLDLPVGAAAAGNTHPA